MSEPTESLTPRPTEKELEQLRASCVQGRVGVTPLGAQKLLAEIDVLREAISKASYALNPNQGEERDSVTAHLWLRSTFASDHPNYIDRATLEEV